MTKIGIDNRADRANRANWAHRLVLAISLIIFHFSLSVAQINISGNVYGGGNKGKTGGRTTVTVRAGDIYGAVYGGARQADVDGSAFVNIDGEHASDYIVINKVYGGNDIAGTIGTSATIPAELKAVKRVPADNADPKKNSINNSWNAFVAISNKKIEAVHYTQAECDEYNAKNNLNEGEEGFLTTANIKTPVRDNQKIYIGQLFGGGNGDYDYEHEKILDDNGDPTTEDNPYYNKVKPELDRAYLEICGGSIVYAYGGGNNATVTDSVVIHYDNPSDVVNSIIDTDNPNANTDSSVGTVGELLTDARFMDMGINLVYSSPSSDAFQVVRFFGGNNKADMAIRPKWNLVGGSIRNVYSGGNEGRMISFDGLLLEIPTYSTLKADNVYGGCRKADVRPMSYNKRESRYEDVSAVTNLSGYFFPPNLAARVLVRGGDVNNVYGGNDVRGKVYFGNAIGIYADIRGDVYGGGNGSYPYTDNSDLATDPAYADFYYNPTKELTDAGVTAESGMESVTALNLVRPNAEQVSIRLAGKKVLKEGGTPGVAADSVVVNTLIGGSVYCGGNSATLKTDSRHASLTNYPLVELKVGSYVMVDKVFLGNNGENMVDQSDGGLLAQYHDDVTPSAGGDPVEFSSLDLTVPKIFAEYMKGCALDIIPSVVFDNEDLGDPATYVDYTAYIGSLYCGGNVGSMTYDGVKPMNFNRKIIIFDKLVGGCNNAIIPATNVNAYYEGGLIGKPDNVSDNKVELILNGLKIEPKRWTLDGSGKKTGLQWNTIFASTGLNAPAIETTEDYPIQKDEHGNNVLDEDNNPVQLDYIPSSNEDLDRRFKGGHVYGGCYSSGVVNGNVVINIDANIMDRERLFDEVKTDELGEEEILYGETQTKQQQFKITRRHTGVLLAQQGMDVLGAALNVFGGGKGQATEIWGSTTINLNRGYTFQVFGGSEEGVIGKPDDSTGDSYTYTGKLKVIGTDAEVERTKTYKYNPKYSCYVNLCGTKAGVSKRADSHEDMAECEFMYGGGFLGPICGNTIVNLGMGRIFNSFAGSCNADILGHTETYIGRQVKNGPDNDRYQYKNVFASHVGEEDYYQPGFPWVRDCTYGGNDLGGLVKQAVDFYGKVRVETGASAFDVKGKVHKKNATNVFTANAYTEYLQGRVDGIFAGCYGTYDYTDSKFKDYFYTVGDTETNDVNLATPKGDNHKPYMMNAIVNFRPTYTQPNNMVNKVYGAGQGQPDERDRDNLQDRSYVLIDIPQDMTSYNKMEVFGAGAWSGVGMKNPMAFSTTDESTLDAHSTIIDLVRGQIGAAYGGSYAEGLTRRTVLNVPDGSTIFMGSIFGGAYGTETLPTCDVFESHVEYHSDKATLVYDTLTSQLYQGALYGGNNNERRTLFTQVNVDVPITLMKIIQFDNEIEGWKKGDTLWTNATVYGAGRGEFTWSEHTEVNLNRNARVYEVYGGGQLGHVLNPQTVQQYMMSFINTPSDDIIKKDSYWGDQTNTAIWKEEDGKKVLTTKGTTEWQAAWKKAWSLDSYYTPNDDFNNYRQYYENSGLNTLRLRTELDEKTAPMFGDGTKWFNTNVIINEGATVVNYAYGGGLGAANIARSGDIWGTTYIALLGGTVKKDLYAAGTRGGVYDAFVVGAKADDNPNGFTASANAYVQGGSARNVYGGGWRGSVGKHDGVERTRVDGTKYTDYLDAPTADDIPGVANVVIGILEEDLPANPKNPEETGYDPHYAFHNGVPAVERNAYGGGEGGAVWGTTNITLRNGYVGYRYWGLKDEPVLDEDGEPTGETIKVPNYVEKLNDETWTKSDSINRLYDSGCVFGGGYIDNSSVDFANVKMYGGYVRNSLFGGGEIAAIGRGKISASGEDNSIRTFEGVFRPGKTSVELFHGHVNRNVFGGGRGYNNLGEGGTAMLYSDGYVFGQTEVHIHGGEVGTSQELALGNGNIFGGGDIGYVYSAYQMENGTFRKGVKGGNRYDGTYEGYYYEHDFADSGKFILYENGEECSDCVESTEHPEIERKLTEDCKVLIEPHCKVTSGHVIKIIKDITSTATDPVTGDETTTTHQHAGDLITPTQKTTLETTLGRSLYKDVEGQDDEFESLNGVLINNTYYAVGEYVPTSALNTLGNKNTSAAEWGCLDVDGIIIQNAVFAGGNTSVGSSKAYANATSVFGNATASIHDVYHRDLITVGTGHTGGLYGDGNLTFVDGYRGLNITNYGTDYYTISTNMEITIDQYHALPAREAAYYELRYVCTRECMDDDGTSYFPQDADHTKASTLTADDIMTLFKKGTYYTVLNADGTINTDPSTGYWKENGVCTIYAGRLMNTIQRADFCGVFGSRMVMKGAQDRVPEHVDYTNYTINRVREVSLNKKISIAGDPVDSDGYLHGNYFGIYSIVNFLGALTSDVDFGDENANTDSDSDGVYDVDIRTTDNSDKTKYEADIVIDNTTITKNDPDYTFYNWKKGFKNDRRRNNGNSHNKVALASGVYLELTTEKSTGHELNEKVWGLITGVIELDLINVQTGLGGGFVYAKNVHGVRSRTNHFNTTLTALNADAVTQWDFKYSPTEDNTHQKEWQTSGNFVHSTQTIIDDCYNKSAKYMGSGKVPAHYWYIKGSVYVYDQYISAYTGAPNAYSETVDIPLTITAASHGTMKLLNVQPNKYAYLNTNGQKLGSTQKLVINDITYRLNDPISYWDWYLLTKAEQNLFVDETYVTVDSCKIGNTFYPEGYVMLPDDYTDLQNAAGTKILNGKSVKAVAKATVDESGNPVVVTDDSNNTVYAAFDFVFRKSNNLSHDSGYILTYKVNNPTEWNTWYTEYSDAANTSGTPQEKQQKGTDGVLHMDVENNTSGLQVGPNDGPTYRLNAATGGLLGQRRYEVSNIISEEVYNTYQAVVTDHSSAIPTNDPDDPAYDADKVQAVFRPAYIVTERIASPSGNYNIGYTMSDNDPLKTTYSSNVAAAYVCTSTIKLSEAEYIYLSNKMSLGDKNGYIKRMNDGIKDLLAEKSITKTDEQVAAINEMSDLTTAELNALSDDEKSALSELLTLKQDIKDNIVPAYYCTSPGLYGGNYYEGAKNYRALEVFSSMAKTDRAKFDFNYDAFDLLIDPSYSRGEGVKYQYDGPVADTNGDNKIDALDVTNTAGYSLEKAVDYTATYTGDDTNTYNTVTLANGREYLREDFEKLPNEKRHYAPIKVNAAGTVYVVNRSIQIGNTPFAVGQTITSSDYSRLGLTDQPRVTALTFVEGDEGKTFYYCRESYKVGHNTEGVAVTNISGKGTEGFDDEGNSVTINTTPYNNNDVVPIGLLISSDNYDNLVNKQTNFIIHGIAPTETSTLFVSRESDINDLSTEKIITVIYQYDYEESDELGNHITPISERHVVNIHIQFKSGVPSVEDIKAPQIVLPGNFVGLREPNVTPGAYEVTGGGWELFEKVGDAENHTNGIEYTPTFDPLYWYQDGYYVAYYAKTYLGKTYSNHVQVSVANYHDLKKVMEATNHHYYVDIPDLTRLKREPKIYINDYSRDATGSKNGLDLLKSLFDLSVLNGSAIESLDANGLITSGTFTGHKPLGSQVHAGNNLEFFLRSDIDHSGSDWTSIGNNNTDECFNGTLHGDGHTISGLSSSLFNHLCGDVYNLGVMGSFTGAGIAEEGSGYVENCWVSTSTTKAKTSKPVFDTPTGRTYSIVNCYYEEDDDAATTTASDDGLKKQAYTNHTGSYGIPTRMSKQAFYNGEVAYDLNGFYLFKRYCDGVASTVSSGFATEYNYWKPGVEDYQTARYGSQPLLCSSGYIKPEPETDYVAPMYVEDRFADGDFIYSGGYIPEEADQRLYTNPITKVNSYYPVWPKDYLFFGQTLGYGYKNRTHQDHPASYATANRVLRAPAYVRSSQMDMVHFNTEAVFAQKKNKYNEACADTLAYPNVTAIDFTGSNGDLSDGYQLGSTQLPQSSYSTLTPRNAFYRPLLDMGNGLSSIFSADLTRNLLVYTEATTGDGLTDAQKNTATVVSNYLKDEAYTETTNHCVAEWDGHADVLHGHWVKNTGSGFMATLDHFLVDRQDFNAPMAYTFKSGNRMWHQRTPNNFVDRKKGWEAISLPFTAEIVTTNQKGEITHFYDGSESSKNETGTKIGHEYWLRHLTNTSEICQKKDDEGHDVTGVLTADLNYPTAHDGSAVEPSKEVDNTFLWEYYYVASSGHNQNDRNQDTYPGDYYQYSRTYTNYPLLTQAVPYVIGFPGATYYEFDLSGTFVAGTTAAPTPEQLGKQTITFASATTGITINVSDSEMAGVEKTFNGQKYTFKPSYMNEAFAAGTSAYTLQPEYDSDNDGTPDCSSYVKVPATGDEATPVSAFRPYFTSVATGGGSGARPMANSILFTNGTSEFDMPYDKDAIGTLTIRPAKHKIVVSSTLATAIEVRVLNTAGIPVTIFTIEPGETIETRIPNAGIYIVHSADGRYIKKLAIK